MFGRIIIVQVSDENGVTRTWDGDGLAMNGEVKKVNGSAPDTAKFSIFNLNPSSRKWVQMSGKLLTITVGRYVRGGVERQGRVFFGDIRRVVSTHEGVDWRTEIEAEDGGLAYQSRTNRAFRKGETYRRVFESLAGDLGLPLGYIGIDSDIGITSGITMSGMTRTYLDNVCGALGVEWLIQSGSLVVKKPGVALPGLGVSISPGSGLIGSAELAKEDDEPGIKFMTVLDAQLVPGVAVAVTSGELNNSPFIIESVTMAIDSRASGQFTSNVEAVSI